MRSLPVICAVLVLLASAPASAAGRDPWRIWTADLDAAVSPHAESPLLDVSIAALPAPSAQVPAPQVAAVEYSDAYRTRARVHKYASFATLPLFATELALGQSLYNNSSDGKRTAHIAVGTAIGGLFGVNTVTGVWNLWEARNDPHGRTRRWVHGLLMLAADGGFAATGALGPNRRSPDYQNGRSTHRAVALTSIGIATAGYLTMLVGGR